MSVDVLRRYWKSMDWVEELLYLSILATEACLIYPWQRLAHDIGRYEPIPLWGLCVLLWAAYLVSSLIGHSELTADRKQALVAALVLISALLTIRVHVYGPFAAGGLTAAGGPFPSNGRRPLWDLSWIADMVEGLFNSLSILPPELLVIIVVLIAWWRGIVASRKEIDIQQIWFLFRLGIVLLVVYFGISLLGQRADMTGLIFVFFFFGLMSIALARILELGGIHQSTLGSKQWIGVLAGAILGNLGLALLASLLFSRQVIRTILGWFQPLVRLVQMTLWYLLSAVIYLLWPLIMWAFEWVRQVSGGELGFLASPLMSPLADSSELAEQPQVANWMPVCRTVSVLLIVIGGLFLVTLAVRRLAAQRSEGSQDERESLWSGQDFANDLKNALRRTLDQLRNLGQLGDRKQRSAESIRKIYASVVDLAAEAGYPRDLAETPYEHQHVLYQAFPGGKEAVDAITEAYVHVHYGEVPDSEEEMEQLRRYWQDLQRLVVPKPVDPGE